MAKKNRVVQAASKLLGVTTEVAASPSGPALGGEWWCKMTTRQFKDTIAKLDYAQCVVLLETVRQAVRSVTLRPHVEDLTLEQQKIAARLAPIHRGCAEALLVKIHGFPMANKALTD